MTASPELIKAIEECDPDEPIWLMEPRADFDECIVGVADRFHSRFAVYDKACVLRVLEEGGDAPDQNLDAIEFFEFNVVGAWIGEGTPAFLITDPEQL